VGDILNRINCGKKKKEEEENYKFSISIGGGHGQPQTPWTSMIITTMSQVVKQNSKSEGVPC